MMNHLVSKLKIKDVCKLDQCQKTQDRPLLLKLREVLKIRMRLKTKKKIIIYNLKITRFDIYLRKIFLKNYQSQTKKFNLHRLPVNGNRKYRIIRILSNRQLSQVII
jgi:hypothetical protein